MLAGAHMQLEVAQQAGYLQGERHGGGGGFGLDWVVVGGMCVGGRATGGGYEGGVTREGWVNRA